MSIQYLPIPARVWSRVQRECTNVNTSNSGNSLDYALRDYKRQEHLKGNILQYKCNSSNLTKKQRYAQIAKGLWASRTKTWATQTQSFSNPNTLSLKRVNYGILDPSNNAFSRPPNPYFFYGCRDNVIRDGGNLICNVTVNPCTDEVIKKTVSQKLCNPTTDSNVPGPVQYLCWNDGDPTWYPRQQYVMPTSGNKFPVNYKFLVSAVRLAGPILSIGPLSCFQSDIPLSWSLPSNACYPITSYLVFKDGVLIQELPSTQMSTIVFEPDSGTYAFFVVAVNNSIDSVVSNTVVVDTQVKYVIEGPCKKSYDGTTVTLTFDQPGATTSLTTYCPLKNQTITCVGAGGGGGGGSNKQSGNTTLSAAGGGGGGGITMITGSLFSVGSTNTVTVGAKGTAGGGNLSGSKGGDSRFQNTLGSVLSYGGGGGNGHYFGCGGGVGGSASITSFVGGTIYNGGNGGNGYQAANPTVTATNGSPSSPAIAYSGGGGGGEQSFGGNAGYLGAGGLKGNQTSSKGQDAEEGISYGSGGGGAGCPSSTGSSANGGNGASGIVIISFQYP